MSQEEILIETCKKSPFTKLINDFNESVSEAERTYKESKEDDKASIFNEFCTQTALFVVNQVSDI